MEILENSEICPVKKKKKKLKLQPKGTQKLMPKFCSLAKFCQFPYFVPNILSVILVICTTEYISLNLLDDRQR